MQFLYYTIFKENIGMDDSDWFISTFYGLSEEVVQQLTDKKIEAQCIFTQQPDFEDQEYFVPASNVVLLQIRGNYVVQCEPKTKKIAGGMQICLDNKFQVRRRCDDPSVELGQPYAIAFYIPSRVEQDDEIVLKFGVRRGRSQQLQKFIECLQRKNIYQMRVHERYTVLNRLLYSSTASLYTATQKTNGQPCIIKCISKQLFEQSGRSLKKAMERQFSIPHSFNHPNICRYYGLFDSDDSTYIVMERLDLNLWLYLHSPFFKTEMEIKLIFKRICQAIKIMHDNGIMHRDLKPENIVLRKITNFVYEPVLIDFGLAEFESKEPFVFTRCGTPGYTAPQITNKQYPICAHGRSSDIFSLGCVFHVLLLGRSPFDNDNPLVPRDVKQIIRKNTECKIDQTHKMYDRFLPEIKKLLFWMLEADPKKRPSISQVLQSPFFDSLKDKNEQDVSKEKEAIITKLIENQRQKQKQKKQKQLKQKAEQNAMESEKQKKQKSETNGLSTPQLAISDSSANFVEEPLK